MYSDVFKFSSSDAYMCGCTMLWVSSLSSKLFHTSRRSGIRFLLHKPQLWKGWAIYPQRTKDLCCSWKTPKMVDNIKGTDCRPHVLIPSDRVLHMYLQLLWSRDGEQPHIAGCASSRRFKVPWSSGKISLPANITDVYPGVIGIASR